MHVRSRTLLAIVATAAAITLALPAVTTAAADERTLAIGTDQVAEGKTVYANACAECHGSALEGMAHFPALVGPPFQDRWNERTVGELHTYVVEQMPLGAAGTLSDEAYAAVVAYLLERNGVEPGAASFDPSDEAAMELGLPFGD